LLRQKGTRPTFSKGVLLEIIGKNIPYSNALALDEL
jgi:hypothetical protein